MADNDPNQVLSIVQWNSVVDSVNQNAKAIEELKAVPEALSELKAVVIQMIPGSQADEYENESEVEDGQVENEDDDLEQTVKELMMGNKPSESPSSLQDILDQTQTEPEYGTNLREDIAQSFSRLISKKISKESLQKWKDQYKPPDNCRTLGIPRVNPEIWSALPNRTRQSDVHLQTLQANVSMTSVALARMAEKIMTEGSNLPGQWQQQLLQSALECATINSMTNQSIITQRKKEIRPSLSKEAASICGANNVTTDLLFGENFHEEIKASKSALNVVKPRMMKSSPFRGTSEFRAQRFQPYNYNMKQGNFQRPPQQNYRGGPRPRFPNRRPQMMGRQFKPMMSTNQQQQDQ